MAPLKLYGHRRLAAIIPDDKLQRHRIREAGQVCVLALDFKREGIVVKRSQLCFKRHAVKLPLEPEMSLLLLEGVRWDRGNKGGCSPCECKSHGIVHQINTIAVGTEGEPGLQLKDIVDARTKLDLQFVNSKSRKWGADLDLGGHGAYWDICESRIEQKDIGKGQRTCPLG